MFACLVANNLYIMDIVNPFSFAFLFINEKTWKTWHAWLSNHARQKIIKLAKNKPNDINLTKLLPYSVYKLCLIGNLQAKAHQNQIKPGLEPLDLVYSEVTGFYIEGLYRVTYFITFLCNATKRSEDVLLIKKSRVLPAFKEYCLYHKKRDKRV